MVHHAAAAVRDFVFLWGAAERSTAHLMQLVVALNDDLSEQRVEQQQGMVLEDTPPLDSPTQDVVLKAVPSFSVLKVARLLGRVESRMQDTERDMLPAVRCSIQLTENIIGLVRSATATTQSLTAPAPPPGSAFPARSYDWCSRVALAKSLVKVVDELNHSAGRMNRATASMIKLSTSLAPREADCSQDCIGFMLTRADAVRSTAGQLKEVQSQLNETASSLTTALADPRLAEEDLRADSEREAARNQLQAMEVAVQSAIQQLRDTAVFLGASIAYLHIAVRELAELGREVEFDPRAVAGLTEQLECPVCYHLPLPPCVWVCDNGHLLCRSCRRAPGVVTCPTCRGALGTRPALLLSCWAGALLSQCPNCHGSRRLRDMNQHLSACPSVQSVDSESPAPSSIKLRATRSWCAGEDMTLVAGKLTRRDKLAVASSIKDRLAHLELDRFALAAAPEPPRHLEPREYSELEVGGSPSPPASAASTPEQRSEEPEPGGAGPKRRLLCCTLI